MQNNNVQRKIENKKTKMVEKKTAVSMAVVFCAIGLILGSIISGVAVANFLIKDDNAWVVSKSNDDGTITSQVTDKMKSLEAIINKLYYEDVDVEAVSDSIYKGMFEGLGDPYSEYYTSEEYEEIMESSSGAYKGIGVTVSQDTETNVITVISVFENSPAEEAGIKANDILRKVNDEDVAEEDVSTVVAKIKGEEGETVKITVERDGETLDFDIERREIEIDTVKYQMLEGNVGYIQIAEFDTVTVDQFKEAIDDLNNQGMVGLVIDLRDNPGGLLTSVVDMCDYILPEGLIVYTEDKYGNKDEEYSDADTNLNVPLAVLVNGNSASASEIFSGAVQDYGVGTLVGTTTFGKGIVQEIRALSDGSAIKLTVSKYYTPKGRNIHGTGLEPDVEVELDESLTADNYSLEVDNQLQAAIDEVTK